MKKYLYTAKDKDGKRVRGYADAENEQELYEKLRGKALFLLRAKAVGGRNGSRKMKAKELSEFTRELGTLLQAGVPLIRALTIIAQEEAVKPSVRAIYNDMLELLCQGVSFSEALEAQGNVFPELLIHMMRTAEVSGNLSQVSLRLAVHYEKEYKLNGKVKSAMLYPIILLVITVAVVLVVFTYVLPQFAALFENAEDIPFSTRVMLGISDVLIHNWLQLILLVVLLLIGGKAAAGISKVRYYADRMKLRIPVVGRLLRTMYTARFARTLSSLYAAGIPMVTALQISRRVIGNACIERQFDEVISGVCSGEPLSQALRTVDGFVKKFASAVMVGEETGKLDQMLVSMADTLDFEAERAIERMVAMLEPLMIVVMAVIVGAVIISVIGPIYASYDAIGAGA